MYNKLFTSLFYLIIFTGACLTFCWAEEPATSPVPDPSSSMSKTWEIFYHYGNGAQIHGVPRSLTILAVGLPLPQLQGFDDNADFHVERGPVVDAHQGDRPARAFRFLLRAKHAGHCTLPTFALTAKDLVQPGHSEIIDVQEPKISDRMHLIINHSVDKAYPGQAINVSVTWTTTIPLYAIKAMHLVIPEFSTPDFKVITVNDPEHDNRKNAIGLPIGETRMIGLWEEQKKIQEAKSPGEPKVIESIASNTIRFNALIVARKSGRFAFDQAVLQCSVDQAVLTAAAEKKSKNAWKGPIYPSYFNNDFFDSAFDNDKLERLYCTATVRSLNILPFPGPTPDNFTGIIGKPEVLLSCHVTSARVGDPLQLTIQITHTDPVALELPKLDQLPAYVTNFRLADNRSPPTFSPTTAVYHQTIWPLRPDIGFIPPLIIPYFDPVEGRFRDAESNPLPITVEESEQTNALDGLTSDGKPMRNPINEKAGGIHHALWGPLLLEQPNLSYRTITNGLWWSAILLPPFAVLLRHLWLRWTVYRLATWRERLAASAHRRYRKQLQRLKDSPDPRPLFTLVEGYLRDRFDLPSGHLDFSVLTPALNSARITPSALETLRIWFDRQEQTFFNRSGMDNNCATAAEALAVIDALEGAVR
jgi:hypothetical protein